MEAVAKVKSGEQTVEEAFAALPAEEQERLRVYIVDADGSLRGIEPIDYVRWQKP